MTMAGWFRDTGCPVITVDNKLDKLKKSQVEPNLSVIRERLSIPKEAELIPFSAERGDGRETLAEVLERFFPQISR